MERDLRLQTGMPGVFGIPLAWEELHRLAFRAHHGVGVVGVSAWGG